MQTRTRRPRRRSRTLTEFDALETRALRASIQLIAPATLLIVGTNDADFITVEPYDPGGDPEIRATVTDWTGKILADRKVLSQNVGRIEVLAEDGDDVVVVDVARRCDIDGGVGKDVIKASDARDTIDGGEGDDFILAGGERDSILGGPGIDTLYGGEGEDTLDGGDDDDELWGEDGPDSLVGGEGNDVAWGGPGVDTLLGGDGGDTLHGDENEDFLWGGLGNDSLEGGAAVDVLRGEENDDTLDGGAGDDSLYGGPGNDRLYGGKGQDRLEGGEGLDGLLGGRDADGLPGGDVDTLIGGPGPDRFLQPLDLTVVLPGVPAAFPSDVAIDSTSEDVPVYFKDGAYTTVTLRGLPTNITAAAWTDSEILAIDGALGQLAQHEGSNTLLRTCNYLQPWLPADALTFIRRGVTDQPSIAGYNSGDGTISLLDESFDDGDAALRKKVYHEIGHNWDDENPLWNDFLALSGWVPWLTGLPTPPPLLTLSGDGEWVYLSTAVFARDYGRTNPHEDFATSFEAYFADVEGLDAGASLIPDKIAWIDSFLTLLP